MAATPREQLMERLETMTDEEIVTVLEFTERLKPDELPSHYDPTHDPLVGFISGPTDFGERAEEILWEEFGKPDEDVNA